jgi:hypothetical protein
MFGSDMRKLYRRFFALGLLLCALALLTFAPTSRADGACNTECANTYMDCNNECDDFYGHIIGVQSDQITICKMEC